MESRFCPGREAPAQDGRGATRDLWLEEATSSCWVQAGTGQGGLSCEIQLIPHKKTWVWGRAWGSWGWLQGKN